LSFDIAAQHLFRIYLVFFVFENRVNKTLGPLKGHLLFLTTNFPLYKRTEMAMKRVAKWIRVYTYPRRFLGQCKLNEEGIPFKTRFCYCTYSLSRI